MLAIRPNCECCDKDLAPNATDAMICSYECTFCKDCVDNVLSNVCPNCGGGFSSRPIRPEKAWREKVSVQHQPASQQRVNTSLSKEALIAFSASIKAIPPHQR